MSHVFINKPHHKQERIFSCLPACTKMVLEFLGKSLEEKALRDLLGSDRKGTSALNGLRLNASLPEIKVEVHQSSLVHLQGYLKSRQIPCIVGVEVGHLPYWNKKDGLHALVVHGFDDEAIFVNDPYFTHEHFAVPIQDFLMAWSETANILITIKLR